MTTKIDFKGARYNEADMALLAPMWFDEFWGELDQTKLFRAVAMHLRACAGQQ